MPTDHFSYLPQEIIGEILSHLDKVELAQVGRTSRLFYSVSRDEKIKEKAAWPVLDHTRLLGTKCRIIAKTTGNSLTKILLLPNNHIAISSPDHTIRIWDSKTSKNLRTLAGHTGLILSLAMLPPDHLVSGSYDNTLRIWNIKTGTCVQTLR